MTADNSQQMAMKIAETVDNKIGKDGLISLC